MREMLYAFLLGLFFLACVFFFPRCVFGQEVGVQFSLVRFNTGDGRWATMFTEKGAAAVSDSEAATLQLVGSAMLVADTLQTLEASRSQIRNNDGGFESNIIMGRNPSDGTIYLYGGGTLLLYNLGAFLLEGASRDAWLKGWVTVQFGTVASNLKKGWDGF